MNKTLFATSIVLGTFTMSTVFAQNASNTVALEEIIVTAQKRDQNLQEVPLAITALTATALSTNNINQAIDLSKVVPSLVMTQASGAIVPFLRGIGNPSNGQGIEGSTAMYIDGIYYQRLSPLYFKLNNIDRVEVLKGPQGTLFGRNAVGGVIHIVTRDPSPEPELHVEVGYGNYDTASTSLYGSTPITEDLAIDLGIVHSHQSEGWGKNVTTGGEYGWERATAVRSKLVWTPSDATSINFAADYNRLRSTLGIPGLGYRGTTQGNLMPPFELYRPEDIGFYDSRGNIDSVVGGEAAGVTAIIRHDFGSVTGVSLTNYNRGKDIFFMDADYTPQNAVIIDLSTHRKQFSQEFQLLSNPDSPIQWLIGLYHLDITTEHRPASFTGQAFSNNTQLIYGAQEVESNAAFIQSTIPVWEKTNLTGGIRYTRDKVHNYGHTDLMTTAGIVTPGVNIDQSTNFDKITHKVSLDHHFTEEIMGYASYSRGFKSGTYRITPVVPGPPAQPEVLDAYEIGVKSELLNRRLTLNAAIFYYDLQDPQVSRYQAAALGPSLVTYINADSGEVTGFEMEGAAALTEQLTARFGFTVLESKYRSFSDAPFANVNPNPPFGNTQNFPGDASGNYATRSPKFTGSIGLDYWFPVGQGEVLIAGNYYHNDGFFWDPDNRLKQKSYGLLDANISYTPNAGDWRIGIWGKNLIDEKYYLSENEAGGPNGSPSAPAAPRTYGVQFSINF
ncbi:MAG: TonB-dependent receptor [Porticoccaceae bacterium]